ncbi:AEC family transporter [Pelomicrobium sp. G1]|uniref:AEC family transporter n=1 Tax=unclassified Pelomicrobium TaxID=2815318 RepID=UPI003F76E049
MDRYSQLVGLMVQVMLPLSLLVVAGALWPLVFRDAPLAPLRSQLNRLVMYVFYPAIIFSVSATTPITGDLLRVPLLVGIGSLASGVVLYWILYRSPIGRPLNDTTRAVLMVGGMFGNTFNIGVPVLQFFYGPEALRYAVFNDMLMTIPVVWSVGVWICTRLGSHRGNAADQPSVWRVVATMPPIWAFVLGIGLQSLGWVYEPLVNATRFIGQATIPVILFVLGLTVPWRALIPKGEILAVAAVKLLVVPALVWVAARLLFAPMGEPEYAAVVEGTTPTMMTALLLADRFRLDHEAAALLIGWSTVAFWLTLPLCLALGFIQ